jgi:hypothetical protein
MDETWLLQQLQARNDRETVPFLSIHEAYHHLLLQVDTLQAKLEASKRQLSSSQQQLGDASTATGGGSKGNGNSSAYAAALKNEARVRDKLEKVSPLQPTPH